jgi:DNA-directed RNA polymerase subunit RPC12/RpoP
MKIIVECERCGKLFSSDKGVFFSGHFQWGMEFVCVNCLKEEKRRNNDNPYKDYLNLKSKR